MMLTREKFVDMVEAVCIGNSVVYSDVEKLAAAAKEYAFKLAYVPPCFGKYLADALKGGKTGLGAPACGSDFGGDPTEVKQFIAKYFLNLRCSEIDMIMNMMYFRSGMYDEVLADIKGVREAAGDTCLKVIIESPLLTEQQIRQACELVIAGGADYVKTSTGMFGKTTVEQVRIIKDAVGDKVKIKAAGGIQGLEMINELIDIGVARFGLSYGKAVKLAQELA